ncbi:uncharacterized protein TRIREDRAFT_22168 [Trichoderma reesei QM6a]|uniref:Predicted protein n=2 Tax=Hypocrea jecorina TaxID=51453 RepID=G0RHW1_HYPJQ|nr:uncharacterized protein TRIREDRAFT_22168 [Trichoderma reesei QM6a]EGR48871.1 predicted protein [Trichoderma reesei QM6a]ETS02644.1 DUF1917-domain-containing protein [Trichoderma reesei RUT C-30]
MDSDDSDFYGDDETVSQLLRRVADFDVDEWAQQHRAHPGRPQRQIKLFDEAARLHNPYAGISYAWQLTETVDDFLARLPPATTDRTPEVPWIYICNPWIPRVHKREGQAQFSKGNEDEAPEEEGSETAMVAQGGLERLHLLSKFIEGMQRSGQAPSVVEREISRQRKQATGDILKLAHLVKVRTGKWMLFCPTTEVNEVWEIVAKATANNELGIAAKVAPRSPLEDPRKDRLLCVYTADFTDMADVGRVLQKLRELKLVEARGRPIYYKPDAFTYIGISSGNPWGLRASIYSSTDKFPSRA